MIMVDTNVIVDLIDRAGASFDWSADAVADARLRATMMASAIVVGELAGNAVDAAAATALLERFGIGCVALGPAAAHRAGLAQIAYRAAGGRRETLLGDFLIGGHAESLRASLITRDPRRYRRYFPDLILITPETADD